MTVTWCYNCLNDGIPFSTVSDGWTMKSVVLLSMMTESPGSVCARSAT